MQAAKQKSRVCCFPVLEAETEAEGPAGLVLHRQAQREDLPLQFLVVAGDRGQLLTCRCTAKLCLIFTCVEVFV